MSERKIAFTLFQDEEGATSKRDIFRRLEIRLHRPGDGLAAGDAEDDQPFSSLSEKNTRHSFLLPYSLLYSTRIRFF
jgi:hypothetical protein